MNFDLAIRSKRILTPEGMLDGTILISEGKIVRLIKGDSTDTALAYLNAGENVVMPGLIDPHVHINEPGRTEWEGFDTATKAAAAGGITTIIDMPLNSSPVTTTLHNLQLKINAAESKIHVNSGFWGGVIPANLNKLDELLKGGVFGLKAFLTHSGIDEFPETAPADLKNVLLKLKEYGLPLLVHCELSEDHEGTKQLIANPESYAAYLQSRPKSWENKAIEAMIQLCRETGAHVHIVHLSSAEALPMIEQARKEGLSLTVETAPHYLFFSAEEIENKNTLLKCAPPIREKKNNDQLWKGLKAGLIDFVATDHSPAPPEIKELESGNLEKAWGGIAGLQFSLPVTWTAGLKHGVTLNDICKWMCENPARFIGLAGRKGKINAGYDADLVIWDPEKEIVLQEKDIFHRHKSTPYSGIPLKGEVQQTILNGEVIYNGREIIKLNKGNVLLQ